jgi:hypothetical protein
MSMSKSRPALTSKTSSNSKNGPRRRNPRACDLCRLKKAKVCYFQTHPINDAANGMISVTEGHGAQSASVTAVLVSIPRNEAEKQENSKSENHLGSKQMPTPSVINNSTRSPKKQFSSSTGPAARKPTSQGSYPTSKAAMSAQMQSYTALDLLVRPVTNLDYLKN